MTPPYEQRFPWTLDWNLLRTFMVLVEQEGITKAANFLGLTQPTLSSALLRLEESIGQKLIIRSPGNFSVTAAGKVLYKECSTMFGTVSQIPELMTQVRETIGGHISIVLTSHVVSPHFDNILNDFVKKYQEVTFSLTVVDSYQVVERIRENRATMGLCLMSSPEPKLRSEILYRQYFTLYCGPNHKFFGRDHIEPDELRSLPSVAFQTEAESGPLSGIRRLREIAGLEIKVKAVTANLPELRRMVVVGMGIGAMPIHAARKDVEAGLLWPLPINGEHPSVDLFLISNPKRSLSPGETIFLNMLYEHIRTTTLEERTYS